jgi:hypothetical protein
MPRWLLICMFIFIKQETGMLVVTGVFDKTGSKLIKSNTPVLYKRPAEKVQATTNKTRFAVIITYANNTTEETSFDARVSSDAPGPIAYGFFEVQIPVSGSIKSVSIYNREAKKTVIKYNSIILH